MKYFCFAILLCSLGACHVRSKAYWHREKIRLTTCEDKWEYKKLASEIKVKVLDFDSSFIFDISYFPPFVIGVTEIGDTIGAISHNNSGINKAVKVGNWIKFTPAKWDEEDIQRIKPVFSISPHKKDNDLKCRVKTIYYGNFIATDKK